MWTDDEIAAEAERHEKIVRFNTWLHRQYMKPYAPMPQDVRDWIDGKTETPPWEQSRELVGVSVTERRTA
jgi:hypothetical protein